MSNGNTLSALLTKKEGRVRTDIDCHQCSRIGRPDIFVAVIDFSINGNYKIECPRCGHHHYRVIVNGVVTSDRYDSHHQTIIVPRRDICFGEVDQILSSTASAFMRELWLRPKD